VCNLLVAQKSNVYRAESFLKSGDLIKAFECIDLALDSTNEKSQKTIVWPQTWMVQGDICREIYNSNNVEYRSLCDDPLTVSYQAYLRALSINDKSGIQYEIKYKIALLENELQNAAIKAYNDENYRNAFTRFEQALCLKQLPDIKGNTEVIIDTALVYNCGLTALKAENYDKAIAMLNRVVKVGYGEASTIVMVASAYQSNEDTISAIQVLENGLVKYPEDETILASMIQLLIDSDNTDEALKYLDMVLVNQPTNVKYYILKADLYNQKADTEMAIAQYKAALKVVPENQIALYNLSVIYYNKGIEHRKLTDNVAMNDKESYKQILNQSEELWKMALPYAEKCYQLNATDDKVVELLRNLYYRLNLMDKYEVI
jgi:tetratricopeptide (TPR) repeat protein